MSAQQSRGTWLGRVLEHRGFVAAAMAVSLVCVLPSIAGFAQNPTVTITVDATANRRPIDPNIYGVAHATTAQLNDLNTPLNRNGGNNTTRYNWQLNADNRGNDWYYQSIADSSATAGRARRHVHRQCARRECQRDADDPHDRLGREGRSGPKRSSPGSRSRNTARKRGNDWQWFPDAGNGVRTNGQFVTGNDPNDANVPSNAVFQQGWVQHLVGRWGTNAAGGLRYYILDNEPSIWHSTHRDVRPTGRDDGRDQEPDDRFRERDQSGRPVGARGRARGMGLERLLLQRVRSAIRKHARVGVASGSQQSRRRRLSDLAARPAAAEKRQAPGSVCSTSSRCTTTRRAASSATTCRARCSCGATARPARCGIRPTSMKHGSTTACS